MESAVEPTAGYPPPILKSEFGEEASALEQGQSLAGRAAKEKVPYFSVAVPVQDTSVPVPVFTGMVDAFPIMSVGVDPTDLTLIPLDYESDITPSLEVVSGPSPDRWWWRLMCAQVNRVSPRQEAMRYENKPMRYARNYGSRIQV